MPCSNGFRLVYAKRVEVTAEGKRRTVLLHRFILNEPPSMVDHQDRDGLNCRRYNLREATHHQNCWNRIGPISKHGYFGVDTQTPNRFRGRVRVSGRTIYTPTFDSAVAAAIARDELARQLHGEFCVLNFPATFTTPVEGGTA